MIIEAKNVTKTYRIDGQLINAVNGVDLSVEKGDMVSIMGHSGSGKTTLLNLIGGLTKPDSGTIAIDGVDLWSLNDDSLSELRHKKINFIYQFSSLIPTLTVLENVILPTAFGGYEGDTVAYAKELIETVGLKDKLNSFPAHLSGGQQRRVAIARAFINTPEIVLADEPTGDLDEESENEVIQLFHRMNREKKITFVIITHDKGIAEQARERFTLNNGVLCTIPC